MEASRNQNPNRTEFQAADDAFDTKLTPIACQSEITPAEIDQEKDSRPELASSNTVTSSTVNELEFLKINDDLEHNYANSKKKKKKKKKKKTNPGSSDTTSDNIDANVQGDDPVTSTLMQKPEVDEGSFLESTNTVSSAFQEDEREDTKEGIHPGKRKKKKKKKKKTPDTPETGEFDLSVLSTPCDVNSNLPSNDSLSQAHSSDRIVQEASEIESVITKDPRSQVSMTDETVSELTSGQQELLLTIPTTSGQNEICCNDSNITEECSVPGDSAKKTKKKRKKKKKQEIEYNILSDSESGVVLATGRAEMEVVSLIQVAPERNCTTDVTQQQSQNTNDAEAVAGQADTQLLCVHDIAATSGDTVELIKPDDDSSSNSQSVREERNILCIFKLVYGVGLRSLRKLFITINPSWSNQPSDAAAFDKWKMKLSKDEENSFNNGDVNKWDFSLMTTVLLYSKSCALEMNKSPNLARALQDLKITRNKLLGHPSTERMSDADFDTFWPQLSKNFEIIGAEAGDIAEIMLQPDEVLSSGEYYKQLFLSERPKHVCCSGERKLEEMGSKLDVLIANQLPDTVAPSHISPKDLSGPNWDEWLKFCDMVGDFESHQNQYILVADSLPPEELECFSILRGVSWKMILDFDPMSEEKGFYREFTSKEGQSNLVSMITPAELRKSSMATLLRQIDPQKTQWLFVNGRYSDTEGSDQSFQDWEATSVKHISRLFGCCSDPDKFDRQKPVVCVILPFCKKSLPYLEVTISRLIENFDEFTLRFVSFKHKHSHLISRKFQVRHFDLSPKLVSLGLSEMLTASATPEYRMPSSQAGVSAKLSQNDFLYLKEHLQILYDGCEDLPEYSNDPAELASFFEEHRKSFISGNQISLVSLFDNHDAKREIEGNIRSHVHRLLDQGLTRSVIVEIRHSPGTGGSTIARRVMWDLHKTYPCALLNISSSRHYFDEDNTLSNKFANRITALEQVCHTSPVILIDGKHSSLIEGLSNKLVRMLCNKGKRALLLRCQHGSKTTKRVTQDSSHVHHVFDVNVKLEDSIADLNEFQSKYKEYIAQSLGENQTPNLCRVFHFPLLAMMEEFRPKLTKIVEDTLDEMGGIQQEMAMVVAFLQKYANHPTPAFLLYESFRDYIRMSGDKPTTYEDIKQLFTEHLLNLMVPTDPLRRRGRSGAIKETPPESYTLQHPLVADLVLKKVCQVQECNLFGVVTKFLHLPIYQHECFLPLFEELFLHNKYGRKLKFSILFEDLKCVDSEHAARIFSEAAVKTNDAAIFANAARFLAKKEPPSFSEAKDLIQRAFQAKTSKVRWRSLYHTKGVVLFHEMKSEIHSGKVKDLQRLEELASEVLKAHHEARTFPPTYPHPLIGEVDVWLACIDWIMKNRCNRDSDKTLKFLTNRSPSFFRTCVSDSFNLLDIVDGICQSVPNLTDPEETQRLSNTARLSLLKTFKQGLSVTGRRRDADDLLQACKAICSAPNFPRSSQVELKKLQAHFILSASDSIDTLNHENLEYLMKLLEELVLIENDYRLAYHLMKVCVLVTGPRCYSLEQGLNVSEKWRDVSSNDWLPYFYQMTIYFLKILDGNSLEFAPKYTKALRMCREKSQNHFRSTQSTLFVGKSGQGMSRLITRNTLFRGEKDYATDDSDKVSKFWRVDSRKKLLECKGRIRVSEQSFSRGKSHPYIELVQGNLQLYVGKNADIGQVERDFPPGALVYFVVSFNLHGPVANGITFSPKDLSHG